MIDRDRSVNSFQPTTTQIADAARTRFGTPTQATSRELRFGRKGSLKVQLTGPHAGSYFDFERWEGGHLLDAAPRDDRRQHDKPAALDDDDARKHAQRIVTESVPAAHAGPAKQYLLGTRHLPNIPDGVLYTETHAREEATGALVLPATDEDGAVHGVQLCHLTADGRKAPLYARRITGRKGQQIQLAAAEDGRLSRGRPAGWPFRIPARADAPAGTFLGEGLETTCWAHLATGREARVHLGAGAIRKAAREGKLPTHDPIYVIRDVDETHVDDHGRTVPVPAETAMQVELAALAAHANRYLIPVYLVEPQPAAEDAKLDLDDYARRHGIDAVRSLIKTARQIAGPPPARFAPPDRGLTEARQVLEATVTAFFDKALYHHHRDETGDTPPREVVPVDIGTGKTRVARLVAAARIRLHGHHVATRRGADDATAHRRMTCGVIAVPTHRLGDEIADALRDAGIRAHVWRGREADRQDRTGEMCEDLDAVHDALAAGADVESSACRTVYDDGTEITCPLYQQCAYQAQKPRARDAQVVIVPHDLLTQPLPAAIQEEGVGWLIIDEDPMDAMLRGTDGGGIPVTLDELDQRPACRDGNGREKTAESHELHEYRRHLVAALRAHENGYADTGRFIEHGITATAARRAAALERQCEVAPGLTPGMNPAVRAAAARAVAGNRRIPLRARAWRLIAEALEAGVTQVGGVTVGESEADGGRARAVRLRWCTSLGKGWRSLPTLLLDATADNTIVQHWLPDARMHTPIRVRAPHAHVRQVTDASFSALKLDPSRAMREKEAHAARGHLRDLHAYIHRRAREHDSETGGADVLVIAQAAVETELRAMTLRPNVRFAHFNALRGLDQWKDVRCVIVVGRMQPAESVIEGQHTALTNRAPASRPSHPWWYDNATAALTARGGGPAAVVQTPQHPDDLCERLRWQVCEAELIQAIGRARGVTRGPQNPVEIDVLTDVPLPIEVDEPVKWQDIAPGMRDTMLARGLAVHSASHAAALYPDLWPTAQAARQAARRERCVTFVYREPPKTNVTHLSSFLYQRFGRGQKTTQAEADPALIADPAAVIEDALGEIDADIDQDTYLAARERMRGLRPPATGICDAQNAGDAQDVGAGRAPKPGPAIYRPLAVAPLGATLEPG